MQVSKDRIRNRNQEFKIARHHQLEENSFSLLRQIFAAAYPYGNSESVVDFSSPKTQIQAVNSGRLSFVFLAKQGGNQVFLKIVKPGFVRDNIAFSVLCTEECRLHSSIPTFQTFRGENGKLHQIVPEYLEGVSGDLRMFSGQTMTLTEAARDGINEIPEALNEIPGGRQGQLALMEKLGGYIVKVSRISSVVTENLPNDIETTDPTGFASGRQIASDNFGVSENLTHLHNPEDRKKMRDHILSLLPNLGESPEAESFREGLQRGDLEVILDRFNQLEKNIHESLVSDPAPNVPIHNEVKPANVGAVYDGASNRWEITQSFDFDNMGFGTPENGDQTPLEKDLGRTLSFFAFDPVSGEFYPDNAKATIKGYLERLAEKMGEAEIHRLQDYIQLGIVTSYLWRSSYLAEELLGHPTEIQLARPDPGVHVRQIRSLDDWLKTNPFAEIVEDLQNTPQMKRHRDIERKAELFRNSAYYCSKRAEGTLPAYDFELDAAHDQINCTE